MMIRCLSVDSWSDAALGLSDVMALAHWAPKGLKFKVYVGRRSCPSIMDARTTFRCLACVRVGRGRWLARVEVVKP